MKFIFHTNKICYIFYILFISFIPSKALGDKIVLNAIAHSYVEEDPQYTPLVKMFNEYSEENNLNIELKLNLFTPLNSTIQMKDYGTTVEALLSKKTDKYDIFFYENIYISRYANHFINLKGRVSKEIMDLYSSDLNYKLCTIDDRWVGLPVNIDFTVLFSNMELLNKYHKEVPKTWDELIETGKYIYNEELKDGNNDLMIYSGSLTKNDESGTDTVIEFIHSYRESKEDPFPELDSQTAVDALEKMKDLKNENSTDDEFQMYENSVIERLLNGNAIFLRFFYLVLNPIYKISIIPGKKEGISSSLIGGNNVSINMYSSKEKQEAAIKVLEFITSKEVKKELSLNFSILPGIDSLYDDEELCKIMDCELFKNIQPVVRPTKENENYDEYSIKFRNYVYDYIYGNKSAKDVLKKLLI